MDLLAPGLTFALRGADYSGMDEALPYTEAVALVVRGHVEGIATPGGRVRYLRMLPESERPVIDKPEEETESGRSTAFCVNSLGAYKQPVREVIVRETAYGHRYAVAAGDIVGHVYAHCGLNL